MIDIWHGHPCVTPPKKKPHNNQTKSAKIWGLKCVSGTILEQKIVLSIFFWGESLFIWITAGSIHTQSISMNSRILWVRISTETTDWVYHHLFERAVAFKTLPGAIHCANEIQMKQTLTPNLQKASFPLQRFTFAVFWRFIASFCHFNLAPVYNVSLQSRIRFLPGSFSELFLCFTPVAPQIRQGLDWHVKNVPNHDRDRKWLCFSVEMKLKDAWRSQEDFSWKYIPVARGNPWK